MAKAKQAAEKMTSAPTHEPAPRAIEDEGGTVDISTTTETVKLDRIVVLWDRNVRGLFNREGEDIATLATNIATHGLLDPLIVRSEKGAPFLLDGYRRMAALQMLAANGVLAKDADVRVTWRRGPARASVLADVAVASSGEATRRAFSPWARIRVIGTYADEAPEGTTNGSIAKALGMAQSTTSEGLSVWRALSPELRSVFDKYANNARDAMIRATAERASRLPALTAEDVEAYLLGGALPEGEAKADVTDAQKRKGNRHKPTVAKVRANVLAWTKKYGKKLDSKALRDLAVACYFEGEDVARLIGAGK